MDAPPLTWGVLGTGTVARLAMIPALARLPGARLLAVASQDAARARALADAHAVPRAYGSYAELVADPEIACVYLALPNHLHREWAERAAAAGKHVLCEKPLARDVAEMDAMAAASAAAGTRLMEALMYRFHPRLERVRALLAAGAIGSVRRVEATFSFTLGDQPNYRWQPEQGGGALLDVGGYCVHAARTLLGAEPVAVRARASYGATGIDEVLTGELIGADGRTARLVCGLRGAERQSITVHGAAGMLELPHPAFTAWHADPAPILLHRDGTTTTETLPPADPYALMAARFTDAVRHAALVPYPLAESRATARVLVALARAARTGEQESIESM
jgi:predicted dehydrogenase